MTRPAIEPLVDDIAGLFAAERRAPRPSVLREADRRRAIALAVGMAKPGDTIVIAGKGHEDYQILGDTTIHFSDVEVAAEEIQKCSGR